MMVFMIRDNRTGLFKVKRPLGYSAGLKWDEIGDIYRTHGTASGALKAALKANEDQDLVVVPFELKQC